MLIKRAVLDRIVAGEIDLQFRRWKRPTVKVGGTLHTAAGVLAIESVEAVTQRRITADDARRAGYRSKAELLEELARRTDGELYRIRLRYRGADPRLALRDDDSFSADQLAELRRRLEHLDRSGRRGPWTMDLLRLLARHPHVRAEDLAPLVGLEKARFKADVRKLKTLGLTISHSPGYELSPRGSALLRALDA